MRRVTQYTRASTCDTRHVLGRILVATCAQLPHLDQDGPALLAVLASRGIQAESAVWDDPDVDWSACDLVLIRSTWDYASRRAEFLDWARQLPRVANPADVLAWNTDKRYLAGLAQDGVPTIETIYRAPGEPPELPAWAQYVIKPTISAGAADTARWRRGIDDEAALVHLASLTAAGRTAMLQPYLEAVDVGGESALIYLGGEFSHSVRKAPILTAGSAPSALALDDHDPREQISPRTASSSELAVADRVLDAVPGGRQRLLYARVDLLAGPEGEPVLLELELTEPSLFLGTAPGAVERFAEAVASYAY